MADKPGDIHTLTAFKRRSAELVERMRTTHQPLTLTVKGKPELVVQTTDDYKRMLDELESMQAVDGIRRGLASMRSGRGREARAVFAELEEKYPHLRRR